LTCRNKDLKIAIGPSKYAADYVLIRDSVPGKKSHYKHGKAVRGTLGTRIWAWFFKNAHA
jgi:hypothetical protein